MRNFEQARTFCWFAQRGRNCNISPPWDEVSNVELMMCVVVLRFRKMNIFLISSLGSWDDAMIRCVSVQGYVFRGDQSVSAVRQYVNPIDVDGLTVSSGC